MPLERTAVLQNEICLAGVRELAVRGIVFDRSGPGFEILASGAWSRASRAAKPIEPILDALPMGHKRAGFSAIGILGDMADLIASLDWPFAEEAWVPNRRMVATEGAELSKPHSPQIDRRLHLGA